MTPALSTCVPGYDLMNTTQALFDPKSSSDWLQPIRMLSRAQRGETAQSLLEVLSRVHRDDRFRFLQSNGWGFSTDYARQVNRVIDEFLDASSRREIRQLAGRALADGEPYRTVMLQWFTNEQNERLWELVDQTEIPDTTLLACYAFLEALEAARGSYLLQAHRSQSRPDFSSFSQTPEELAEDLRLVSAV